MIYIRSLVFNFFFYIWTAITVFMALFSIILPHEYVIRVAYLWGIGVHFLLRVIVGVEYEIRGRENWDGSPVLFAAKHQSVMETTMIQVLAFNSAVILKRELLWIPLFGQVIKHLGVIAINRGKGGKNLMKQMINGARQYLDQGRPVFIFPEGTRVSPEKKTTLRYGISLIYRETGSPVIPVALNTGHVWGRRCFLKKPGKVIYQILPPIQPGMDEQAFLRHLENVIEEGCRKINDEVGYNVTGK